MRAEGADKGAFVAVGDAVLQAGRLHDARDGGVVVLRDAREKVVLDLSSRGKGGGYMPVMVAGIGQQAY